MHWIVIIQLGTPDALNKHSIRKYLRQFLMDPMVIDIPWILRYMLVNWIILPRRVTKVEKRYSMIWDPALGSPLRFYGDRLVENLNNSLPDKYKVFHSFRYGSPSIASILEKAEEEKPGRISIFPLFPHDTQATTGSIREEAKRALNKLSFQPDVRWMDTLHDDNRYLDIMAAKLIEHNFSSFDRVLFSFHGLPLRQIEKAHEGFTCEELSCSDLSKSPDAACYTRDCYSTAAGIAKRAGLNEQNYTVAFQSRFGRKWIGPQSEDLLKDFAGKKESVIVMAPSFATDCLETSWEIGISFKELYKELGGGDFAWISALNDDKEWIKALKEMVEE